MFKNIWNVSIFIISLFSLLVKGVIVVDAAETFKWFYFVIWQNTLCVSLYDPMKDYHPKRCIRLKPILIIDLRKCFYKNYSLDISEWVWCHVWHAHESLYLTRIFTNKNRVFRLLFWFCCILGCQKNTKIYIYIEIIYLSLTWYILFSYSVLLNAKCFHLAIRISAPWGLPQIAYNTPDVSLAHP